jgi:hypothetical protein
MKGGYVCLGFQPINVIMNDSNQLNKFWMSCSNINKKGMQDYLDIPKWHTYIQSAKTRLKISNNYFFAPMFLIFLSKPVKCRFIILKINLIVLIDISILLKNPRF